eukprot:CAMPEP_0197435510 /NCGR_PEP_ID=MMETSP1175-20131217/3087_1 /TAXON_ID=1003142 /ORGANISM="Triceratium dubium, Strain CCMP147" /LENGTH=216 /DNA_ID=CAMNT_0042964559 /DNA_START=133 /DNA_END=783 /DNA_ORIENTATION=+
MVALSPVLLFLCAACVPVHGSFSTPVHGVQASGHYYSYQRQETAPCRALSDETRETIEDSNGDLSVSGREVPNFGTWNPFRLAVLKLGMTELRYTSPLNYEKRDGLYKCANCGANLFDSSGKYDSGSGWPSFWRTSDGSVSLFREWDGRIECRCQNCSGHLGHVFPDGPRRSDLATAVLEGIPETDLKVGNAENISSRLPRYCMNGASLRFEPTED